MPMLSLFAALAIAQAPQSQPAVDFRPLKTLEGLRPLAFAPAPTGSNFAVTLEDHNVRIIDANTRQTLKTLTGHPQPCYAIAWSKDNKAFATGDESGRIWLWDTAMWQKTKEFRTHIRGIQKLSFNLKHDLMLSTGKDDLIKVYDLKKNVELRTIAGNGANFYSATFHPKTNEFTTGVLGVGARVYEPDGKLDGFLTGHDNQGVWDVDYNPAGTMIATAGRDNNIILWDAKKREKIQTLHGHQEWVQSVRFSPNGKYLASGSSDRTVRIWDVKTFRTVTILNEQCAVGSPLCWTADGKYLLSVNLDDYLQANSVTPPQAGKWQPVKKGKKGHKIRRKAR